MKVLSEVNQKRLYQTLRFRGKSVRLIIGKVVEYKLFWIGNEKGLVGIRIFLVKKWVDTVIDTTCVSVRNIFIEILIQEIIFVISVYVS